MPADMGGKSPLRDGSNEESILAKIKQISSLLQFKTCAPALPCVSLEIVRMNTQNALISVSPRERLDVLTAA